MKKRREGFCPCEQKMSIPPAKPRLATAWQEKLEADYKASRLFKPIAAKPTNEKGKGR
jgi:hypothetical protein